MKRRAFKLIVFLLLGAIVNVAVAWGCAIYSWSFFGRAYEGQISEWLRPVPSDFGPAQHIVTDKKIGLRQTVASAYGDPYSLDSGWTRTGIDRPFWIQSVNQCGLPFLSLEWIMHYPTASNVQGGWEISGIEPPTWLRDKFDLSKRLANEPVWPGFAINTIFYAGVLWMMFAFPFVVRRRRRIKRGLCPACAYPVGTSPVCTECGAAVNK